MVVKQIRLISLTYRYFKGLHEFTLHADGQDINIYGPNAAGKTTLFDGFYWLLFNKDSREKGELEKWIKTLEPNGEPMHGVQHEVIGVLEIDGVRQELHKVFYEKWTKKRGAAKAEFTGHKTDYYIDGAPHSKGDYEEEIAKIIDEETFKLLTNPSYFAERDWKKRRKLLLEICGDISDSEVISSNHELSELPALMEQRSLEGHRDKIKSDQARINSRLRDIPNGIAEIKRVMPDTDGLNQEMMQKQIETLRDRIRNKEDEMNRIQNGGEIAVKTNRLREIDGELLQIKNEIQAGSFEKISAKRQHLSKKNADYGELEDATKRMEVHVTKLRSQIKENEETRSRLRNERDKEKESQFVYIGEDSCATCGQSLPIEKVEEARKRAEEQFNTRKAQTLEQIVSRGKTEKLLADQWAKGIEQITDTIESNRIKMDALELEIKELRSEIQKLESSTPEAASDTQYQSKLQEREEIERMIRELRSQSVSALSEARLEVVSLRTELESQERKYSGFEQVERGQARINELKAEEKDLARQYEELERQLYLTEEFTRTKVQMLESKINAKFKNVKFRLFETQVNGALNETCKILYGPNLVPYEDGLNRAAQFNAGLDIINTLSEHFKVIAPIFIDNAEAVTDLVKTSGQQIRLIVPPTFENLPAEVQDHLASLYDGDLEKTKAAWEQHNSKLRVESANNTIMEGNLF
ncbi:AAA family ATPase [Paenibacillus glucanolyticus]|uniref:AAA family ATPase n=1 Tax=Paenibacillus glucanolyticus TaxID=59843 RepID=UPI00128BDF1A|nr:AAA family ATPase [Paenibacillus glucanolyticus]MCA4755546.1 AAA family ATPase [Mycolicibacterium fortuitum]MPY20670.1 AAA family ATPase [Paenibacillus glucanolyticus]